MSTKIKGKVSGASKAASIRQLFMFASFRDKLFITLGLSCALVYGVRFSIFAILMAELLGKLAFGSMYSSQLLSHLNSTDSPLSDDLRTISLNNVLIGAFNEFSLGMGITAVFVFSSHFGMMVTLDAVARHQANRAYAHYIGSLLRQDMAWFDDNQTGKLVSRTSDDFQKFQDAIGLKLGLLFSSLFGNGLNIIYCLILNYKLTLAMVLFLPLYLFALKLVDISRTIYSKRESTEYAKAGSIAEEVLGAIKIVKAYGAENAETCRYANNLHGDTKAVMWKAYFATLAMAIFYITYFAGHALFAYLSYRLFAMDRRDKTAVKMITIIYSINLHAFKMRDIFGHLDALSYAKASLENILSLINRRSSNDLIEDRGFVLHEKIQKVAFRNVSFYYPSRPDLKILDDFNLEVKSGETIAIVGESGSGKSTIINLLQRFYDASQGSILLNDTDIHSLSSRWVRRQIGLVDQEPVLFPTTIAENISFGRPNVPQADIEAAARMANAHDFIDELPQKYETLVGDRGSQLSGGQKQRIAIARTLIRDPQVLLLDEATSALDSQNEAAVQVALNKISLGRMTIVVAHRLSTVRNADRIVVVLSGKIVESGTHEQLIHLGGIYSNFAAKQGLDRTLAKVVKRLFSVFGKDQACVSNTTGNDEHCLTSNEIPGSKESPCDENKNEEQEREQVKLKSLSSGLRYLFRLGYLNSALLISGIMGGVIFSVTYIMFNLQKYAFIFLIFAANDDIIAMKAVKSFSIYIGFSVIAVAVSMVLHLGFLGIVSARIGRSLRHRVFTSLMRQSIAYFDNRRNAVGSLCLILSSDVDIVRQGIGVHLGIVISALSDAIFVPAFMFYFSYKFGLMQLGILCCCLLGAYTYQRFLMRKRERKSEILSASNENFRQVVTNIRTVMSLGLETHFLDKLVVAHCAKTMSMTNEYVMSILGALLDTSAFISCALTAQAGLHMVLSHEISELDILRALGLTISMHFTIALAIIPNFVASMNSLQRIVDVIDSKPLKDEECRSRSMVQQKDSELIRFEDVTFSYPLRKDAVALKEFNCSVKAGQTVALVGRSGSGKSTCIQLLERFYEPDMGSISVGGCQLATFDVNDLRKEMAIVLQEPLLFDRSIADNIAYGDVTRVVTMDEIVEAAVIANIHEFICELPRGYETRIGERGIQISGGQKQRIAIARALVRKAKILLLDEATSALDVDTEKKVQQSLKSFQGDTTFVIVAHRLSTIIDADVIVVIDNGRIVETGSHTELMSNQGHYFKLQLQQTLDANTST